VDGTRMVKADVGEGRVIQIEARPTGSAEGDVGIGKVLSFQGVVDSIEAISASVVTAIDKAKPDKASVEFGIDVGVEAGQLTSLLVKGSGSATMKITLTWGA
jgi:NTP-dependent ternary system trypsin peptidase co-occuring protein